jgi:hypothetical protein
MEYIQFEEYGVSIEMNDNGLTLVDGCLWTDVCG